MYLEIIEGLFVCLLGGSTFFYYKKYQQITQICHQFELRLSAPAEVSTPQISPKKLADIEVLNTNAYYKDLFGARLVNEDLILKAALTELRDGKFPKTVKEKAEFALSEARFTQNSPEIPIVFLKIYKETVKKILTDFLGKK